MGFDSHNLRSSDERLWSLIAERAETGADTDAIDRRIWDLFGETWSIMFTDLSGFSRGSDKFGITHFLQVIHRQRQLLYPIISEGGGLLIKAEADSLMVLFRRPEVALDTAIAMQQACANANRRLMEEDRVLLCIGLGYGEILRIGDEDIWGREVNAASKLGEDTAKTDEILVTARVADAVKKSERFVFDKLAQEVLGRSDHLKLKYSIS